MSKRKIGRTQKKGRRMENDQTRKKSKQKRRILLDIVQASRAKLELLFQEHFPSNFSFFHFLPKFFLSSLSLLSQILVTILSLFSDHLQLPQSMLHSSQVDQYYHLACLSLSLSCFRLLSLSLILESPLSSLVLDSPLSFCFRLPPLSLLFLSIFFLLRVFSFLFSPFSVKKETVCFKKYSIQWIHLLPLQRMRWREVWREG